MAAARGLFYPIVAVLTMIMAFVGFWPFYFGPLLAGTYERHWIFHLHGIVFMGWTAILIVQTILVNRRRTSVHMKVRRVAFGVAVLMVALGLAVTIALLAQLKDRGVISTWPEALWATSAPFMDITQFAVLVGLGWLYRHRSDFHKLYMILATIAILPAATARMGCLLGPWSLEAIFHFADRRPRAA